MLPWAADQRAPRPGGSEKRAGWPEGPDPPFRLEDEIARVQRRAGRLDDHVDGAVAVDIDLHHAGHGAHGSTIVGGVERREGLRAGKQESVVGAAGRRINRAEVDMVALRSD